MAREESFFDDLARGLADGSLSRGKALRLMGAALVGGTLGSLGIGEAAGDPPGCKRNGKHCTRPDQCCSLNCSSGSCQTQTTTTTTSSTTSSTTSTSTSTTSTSTSTTSTSTTPMCLQNGGDCSGDTDCCSGNCVNGTCAACPAGTTPCDTQCCQTGATCVNGTCCPNARVCTIGTSVTCCPEGQECGDGACCISNGFNNLCTADTQCCSKICDFLRGRFFCSHCRSLGGLCIAGQCCPNLACENGRCCWDGFGFDCTDDSECCGSATCRDGQCLL
jgi:hypothetical protein